MKMPAKVTTFPTPGVLRPVVPRVLDAPRNVPVVCAVCGTDLPAPVATGRPRVTCTDTCRRARSDARRKLERRRAWLAGWRQLQAAGECTRTEARREIAELLTEIAALEKLAGPEVQR